MAGLTLGTSRSTSCPTLNCAGFTRVTHKRGMERGAAGALVKSAVGPAVALLLVTDVQGMGKVPPSCMRVCADAHDASAEVAGRVHSR